VTESSSSWLNVNNTPQSTQYAAIAVQETCKSSYSHPKQTRRFAPACTHRSVMNLIFNSSSSIVALYSENPLLQWVHSRGARLPAKWIPCARYTGQKRSKL